MKLRHDIRSTIRKIDRNIKKQDNIQELNMFYIDLKEDFK